MTDSKLLLIDGHNLLFQMFFGMPSRIPGKDGTDVRGAVGFVGAVGRITRMCDPTHVAVIFDSETHNPRSDILEEYKANRPNYSDLPECENPFTILPAIYTALDVMGIRHAEIASAECDDVIASYTLRYKSVCEIVISSHDSDFLQLISDDVRVVRYRGDSTVICDKKYVTDKFGVPPELYIDSKALFGDSADNIPGISGIGPKTAAKLVLEAGGADNLIKDSSVIANPRHRKMIEDSRKIIERNLALMRLSDNAPLPIDIDELIWENKSYRAMDILRDAGII